MGIENKKARGMYIALAAAVFALTAAAFFHYINFVGRMRDKEVASQLSEVYGQMNNRFNELSRRNWNLLSDGALAFSLSDDEDLMDAYVAQLKEQWGFNTWVFIDDDGRCLATDGRFGYLNLGKEFIFLTQDKKEVVVDGTLAGSEPVLLFAIPVDTDTYRGFSFTAVALAYDKEAMKKGMEDISFGGTSASYLLYPDGRILLSLRSGIPETKNLFTMLKQAEFKHTEYQTIHDGIQDGKRGTCRYSLNGTDYYLYYQPVGFQDWMMVGVVPQTSVGVYVGQMVRRTVLLSALCFGLLMAVFLIFLYTRHQLALEERDQELSYRERMFEILSNNTQYLFMVLLPDTRTVEYVSSNAERMIGYSDKEIKNNVELLTEAEFVGRSGLKWEDLKAIRLGESDSLETVRLHGKTGEKLWFEEVVYHVKVGEIERFIFILQDRTKEREDKQNLKMALDIAKTANESKSSFLSNMSHDIRTPMNVIIGFMPLLLRDAENPEKVREYAHKISASSQHLLGLINDILDMSRIESGKTSLHLGEFRLAEFTAELSTIIWPQANAKNQSFDVLVSDIRYETLVGDSTKLSQILVNILSNAVKYTPSGGHIRLSVKQLPQTTKNIVPIRFVVEDNGIGMSKEYQKIIFEPFTREENKNRINERGTGLGMPIVKNLLDLMGGSISIESELGQGSRFTVELGLRIQDEEVDENFWKDHSLFRALVVDDNQDICENVVQTVLHSGLDMEYALSGQSAVEKVKAASEEKKKFDLVLLDWKMPGMDGIETAEAIRMAVPEYIPILILTAYDWSEIETEARRAGIDGFLPKPFFLSNFKDAVEQLCSQKPEESAEKPDDELLKGMHVLIVEDYGLNAEILAGILEMYGMTSEICEDGRKAVELFYASEPGHFDVILMDIQMPVMNGYDSARAIRRSRHPEASLVPIVAMSANAFSEDVQKAMESGMDAYLTKPVDAGLLKTTLMKYAGKNRGELCEN